MLRCGKNFVPPCFKLLELLWGCSAFEELFVSLREKSALRPYRHTEAGSRRCNESFCRAGAGGKCSAMRVAQHTNHVHALGYVEFTSI